MADAISCPVDDLIDNGKKNKAGAYAPAFARR